MLLDNRRIDEHHYPRPPMQLPQPPARDEERPIPVNVESRQPDKFTPRTMRAIRQASARLDLRLRLRWFIRG